MTAVRQGFDLAVDVLTSGMWALAAFFIGTRLFSSTGGTLLALAVFVTALSFVAGSRLQEQRARQIAAGACPRCHQSLSQEHAHRRWDSSLGAWLPPSTQWRCANCSFEHEVTLACESCPDE